MSSSNAAQTQREDDATALFDRFFSPAQHQKETAPFEHRTFRKTKDKGDLAPKHYLQTNRFWARFFDIAIDQAVTAAVNDEAISAQTVTDQTAPNIDFPLVAKDSDTAVEELALNTSVEKKASFVARLKTGLSKTRGQLTQGLSRLFQGQAVNDHFFDELETQLIMADVGIATTSDIIEELKAFAKANNLMGQESGRDALKAQLKQQLIALFTPETPKEQSAETSSLGTQMILVVGVNGVGKTTTIGKLAQQAKNEGKSVMLAAGDTFRAAAVEQLQIWGERTGVSVISQGQGADSASVVFDALQSAKAKNIDLLIADTAGRLHNKANLMSELQKIVRVIKKIDPSAPHRVLLVLDGCTGQNALSQGKSFHESVPLSGLVVTKLDGTAKGGILFALIKALGIGVDYIGIGEGVDDLRAFDPVAYVDALLDF